MLLMGGGGLFTYLSAEGFYLNYVWRRGKGEGKMGGRDWGVISIYNIGLSWDVISSDSHQKA